MDHNMLHFINLLVRDALKECTYNPILCLTFAGLGGLDGRGRQRHASAGQASTSNMNRESWCNLLEDISQTKLPDIKPFDGGNSTLDTSLFSSVITPNSSGSGSNTAAAAAAAAAAVVERKDPIPDELDMALSALKDCDNEFSKFVQDNENGN